LEAVTPIEPDGRLAQALVAAQPRSCLAVRLGRTHCEQRGDDALLACELCDQAARSTICEPLLVGGKVIGSLLVTHERDLDAHERRTISETVGYAAPVLANLRNLAIAERRAYTDSLTALPNRRALEDTFKLMLAQAGRLGTPLAAMLIDLDHFKQVNDTYGHDCGDEVLALLATVLSESVRSSDFVARMGGEEFVVLLPATDPPAARNVAEAIAARLASTHVAKIGRAVTASFGVAGYPEHGLDGETLLRCADRALYQAKQDGRNCVRLAAAAPARGDRGRLLAESAPTQSEEGRAWPEIC
jgi:diguanylate cyclase (GGDEF)-like protein